MNDCIIAMRSVTIAQKSVRILTAQGILCNTVNIDPSITKRGCGYGVALPCRLVTEAKRILERKHVEFGDIIGDSGRM
jgi:hypothetical protein